MGVEVSLGRSRQPRHHGGILGPGQLSTMWHLIFLSTTIRRRLERDDPCFMWSVAKSAEMEGEASEVTRARRMVVVLVAR